MTRIALTRNIAASLADVSVFFVPQRMTYWYGAEMQSCFEVQDGAADFSVGLKIRITGRIANREVSHTAVITAFQPRKVLEWRFQDSYGVRGRERWELEQSEADSQHTLVRFVDEYQMPSRFARAFDWLVTRHSLARRNREYLDRLARLVERRP